VKKALTGVLVIALAITFSALAFASNGEKTATPSQTKFVMDGKEVSLDSAYLIDESNYLQLRSVAELLSGTKSQFNVYWDNGLRQAVIETGKPYTGVAPAEITPLPSSLPTPSAPPVLPSATPSPSVTPPKAYKIGDTIILSNATIRLTAATTADSTPQDEYGSAFVASSGHLFLCVSFEVTVNSLNYNNTLWHPSQFIKYAMAASGANYEMPFSQGTSGFGAKEKKTATVYIEIPDNEIITSVIVSDGVGESATVSVQ
jgi:hypothetical protein